MSKTSSASFDDNVLRLAGGAGVVKGAVLIAAPTQALRVAFKSDAQRSTDEVKCLTRALGACASVMGASWLVSAACEDRRQKRRNIAALGAVCMGGAALHAHMASTGVTRKEVSVPGAVLGGALGAALLVYGLRGERGAGSAGKA